MQDKIPGLAENTPPTPVHSTHQAILNFGSKKLNKSPPNAKLQFSSSLLIDDKGPKSKSEKKNLFLKFSNEINEKKEKSLREVVKTEIKAKVEGQYWKKNPANNFLTKGYQNAMKVKKSMELYQNILGTKQQSLNFVSSSDSLARKTKSKILKGKQTRFNSTEKASTKSYDDLYFFKKKAAEKPSSSLKKTNLPIRSNSSIESSSSPGYLFPLQPGSTIAKILSKSEKKERPSSLPSAQKSDSAKKQVKNSSQVQSLTKEESISKAYESLKKSRLIDSSKKIEMMIDIYEKVHNKSYNSKKNGQKMDESSQNPTKYNPELEKILEDEKEDEDLEATVRDMNLHRSKRRNESNEESDEVMTVDKPSTKGHNKRKSMKEEKAKMLSNLIQSLQKGSNF